MTNLNSVLVEASQDPEVRALIRQKAVEKLNAAQSVLDALGDDNAPEKVSAPVSSPAPKRRGKSSKSFSSTDTVRNILTEEALTLKEIRVLLAKKGYEVKQLSAILTNLTKAANPKVYMTKAPDGKRGNKYFIVD